MVALERAAGAFARLDQALGNGLRRLPFGNREAGARHRRARHESALRDSTLEARRA
jgi:hypothetical protein